MNCVFERCRFARRLLQISLSETPPVQPDGREGVLTRLD